MARTKRLTDAQFRSANAAALAVVGASPEFRSVKALLDHDMREMVRDVTPIDERYGYLPPLVDVRAGGRLIKDVGANKAQVLAKSIQFGGRATLTPAGEVADIDLMALLLELMRDLSIATMPFARSGTWGRSLRYAVGGKFYQGRPPQDFSIGGVINLAPYASAMENPHGSMPPSHRVYQRVWQKWVPRAQSEGFDIRWNYWSDVALDDRKAKRGFTYPSPIIQIGYLNSMKGRTGKQFQHRGNRRARRGRF